MMRSMMSSAARFLASQRHGLVLLTTALAACTGVVDGSSNPTVTPSQQTMVERCGDYGCTYEVCGDGLCAIDEQWNCPSDCGLSDGYCGDGFCGAGEDAWNCASDCGPSTYCGDGACNGGETSASCPADCGSAPGVVLGRFSTYCGKVNSHQSPGGGWTTDSDCSSGCNVGGLAYCQKFWPGSTSIRQVNVSSKPNNIWTNAGCGPVVDDWDGDQEFECLGGSFTENVSASSKAQEKHGVAYYVLEEANSVYTVHGYGGDGRPLLTLQWSGASGSDRVEFQASQGGVNVQFSCLTSSGTCVLQENGTQVTAEALSVQAQHVLSAANDYFADVQGNLVPACSVNGYAKLSPGGRRFANGVCYLAGACATIWPIGTLICGPTFVGCTLGYFSGAL